MFFFYKNTFKIIPDAYNNLTAINFIQKGRISKKDFLGSTRVGQLTRVEKKINPG